MCADRLTETPQRRVCVKTSPVPDIPDMMLIMIK